MITKSAEQNYYEILEIRQDSSHQEIVAAYERAKNAYAPDSPALYTMFSKEEAEELRKIVDEAFLILGNETKRRQYDQLLMSRKSSNQKALPDFAPLPERPSVPNASTAFHQNISSMPEGFARSRLSVYEKKDELENEINNLTFVNGEFLRKIRQYKNINIDQLSKETRISRSYLLAIESEDLDVLPAPVFLRGFVIQFAKMLGLNENLAASLYMENIKKKG